MVTNGEEERQDGSKYQHEEFRLREAGRFVPGRAVTVSQGGHLGQDVDRGLQG